MQSEHSVSAHWDGVFDEPALQVWAEQLRRQLKAPQVSLGLVFMAPRFFPHAAQVLEILRVHGQIPLLAGCSSKGLIAGDQEIEQRAGIALALYHLPGAQLRTHHFTQEEVEEANGPVYWHLETDVSPEQSNGWLVFADPFHLNSEKWLKQWNEAYAPLPILGGLASGNQSEQLTQVYLNGEVFETGGVAISVGGEVRLAGVISQGCTPIGETWTITKAEGNIIKEIGNRPAYNVLVETYEALSLEEKRRLQNNLFVGLVINEYLDEFHRGDFLIRNLLGATPENGCLAIGAYPRPGQTLQFQCRDANAATEDMAVLLTRAKQELANSTIYGASLHCCNGRGSHMFRQPNHDAQMIEELIGPFGMAGFFCNGEIGPVGDKNFLHGYTASLALFVKK